MVQKKERHTCSFRPFEHCCLNGVIALLSAIKPFKCCVSMKQNIHTYIQPYVDTNTIPIPWLRQLRIPRPIPLRLFLQYQYQFQYLSHTSFNTDTVPKVSKISNFNTEIAPIPTSIAQHCFTTCHRLKQIKQNSTNNLTSFFSTVFNGSRGVLWEGRQMVAPDLRLDISWLTFGISDD